VVCVIPSLDIPSSLSHIIHPAVGWSRPPASTMHQTTGSSHVISRPSLAHNALVHLEVADTPAHTWLPLCRAPAQQTTLLVRNGIYDEALDLHAFISRVALLHPELPILQLLAAQVGRRREVAGGVLQDISAVAPPHKPYSCPVFCCDSCL